MRYVSKIAVAGIVVFIAAILFLLGDDSEDAATTVATGSEVADSTESSKPQTCAQSIELQFTLTQQQLQAASRIPSLDASASFTGNLQATIGPDGQGAVRYQWQSADSQWVVWIDATSELYADPDQISQSPVMISQTAWIARTLAPMKIAAGDSWRHQGWQSPEETVFSQQWSGQVDDQGFLQDVTGVETFGYEQGQLAGLRVERRVVGQRSTDPAQDCEFDGDRPDHFVQTDVSRLHQLNERVVNQQKTPAGSPAEDIASILDAPSDDDRIRSLSRLTNRLRQFPEQAKEVGQAVREASSGQEEVALPVLSLMGALAGAQHKQAQAELSTLLTEFRTAGQEDHQRAILRNMGLLVAPRSDLVAKVFADACSDAGAAKAVRSTALLTLGSLVSRATKQEKRQQGLRCLEESLADPEMGPAAIAALGNTRLGQAKKLLEQTAEHHPDEHLQRRAREALERFVPMTQSF